MRALVTGGAGFIGSKVVEKLLKNGEEVWVIDNLSNGREKNLENMIIDNGFKGLYIRDIKENLILEYLFQNKFDVVYHLAAIINVQDSIDNPRKTFEDDVIGTFNLLCHCKKSKTKFVYVNTCMIYDKSIEEKGIDENHLIKPTSPYAGAKIAAENLVQSFFHTYNLPTTIIRLFNTYGPSQKTDGEGGVVSVFIKNKLKGNKLNIFGDGNQTRDLLYVEDAARGIVLAGISKKVNGEIINIGAGSDISINNLAKLVENDISKHNHVKHIHPQSEIEKLICNYSKAKKLLGWEPTISLKEGIIRTEKWIKENEFI